VPSRKVYDLAVHEALIVFREAAGRICGKRLQSIIPQYVESMEKRSHLTFAPEVRRKLLAACDSTLDRLLKPSREVSKKRK